MSQPDCPSNAPFEGSLIVVLCFQTSLVEKHVERILGLESALRQRENSLQKLNMQLHSKDMQYLQLHAGPDAHSE